MDKLKILYCGYREWSTTLYSNVSELENKYINWNRISTAQELIDEDTSVYDIIFFIGWSEIIPDEIVNNNVCICLHPSRLPKYRGGSPIQHQIINGETTSSVTLFRMNSDIDTGDIVYQSNISLSGDLVDVFSEIIKKGYLGIQYIVSELMSSGVLTYTPQNHNNSTLYKRRKVTDSEITTEELLNSSVRDIYNKVRCLQDPYPNAYIKLNNGEKLYLYKVVDPDQD